MTPPKDIGLSVHRITQLVITGACMALLYLSRNTYEEVDSLGKEMSAIRVSVDTQGDQINELKMDFRELQKDVRAIEKPLTTKPKQP